MRTADLMVESRRWVRFERRGEEGRCLRWRVESDCVLGEERLGMLVWEVADWRELTEVEKACWERGRWRVLLLALDRARDWRCEMGGWRVSCVV
jgi:hypothetical protein